MKKLLSCLLTLCILCGAMPLCAHASDALRLFVAADTHYHSAADLGERSSQYAENMLDRELFDYVSSQGQMNYESRAIVQAMLDAFVESDAPYLLIAGDLTGGKRQSHAEFAQMLRDTEARSGKSVFVINGNHDCAAADTDERIGMETFRDLYHDFGYDRACALHDASASYAADLSDSVRLLAVDSCIYGEDEGEIDGARLEWLRAQLAQAAADGRQTLVMMHHSILPHYALQPMFNGCTTVAQTLADNGATLVLTGHIHANDIACASTKNGSALYDVQTGSLITSPNAYRVLTLSADAAQIETRFITRIDTSLLPDGYSVSQLERLRSDFPAYAYGCLEAGVCKWFNRNIGSPNRFVRWFKVREGTYLYTLLERAAGKAGEAIGLDLYAGGEGESMEEILLRHGDTLPQSDYKKLYQPAARIMYGFFHGDEETVSNAQDAALLRKGVRASLLYALPSCGGSERLLRLPGASAARDAVDVCGDVLIRTLANGFVDDYSAPSDLDCTLSLRDAPQQGALPFSRAGRLWNILIRFWRLLWAAVTA